MLSCEKVIYEIDHKSTRSSHKPRNNDCDELHNHKPRHEDMGQCEKSPKHSNYRWTKGSEYTGPYDGYGNHKLIEYYSFHVMLTIKFTRRRAKRGNLAAAKWLYKKHHYFRPARQAVEYNALLVLAYEQ